MPTPLDLCCLPIGPWHDPECANYKPRDESPETELYVGRKRARKRYYPDIFVLAYTLHEAVLIFSLAGAKNVQVIAPKHPDYGGSRGTPRRDQLKVHSEVDERELFALDHHPVDKKHASKDPIKVFYDARLR